jgi:hypothetical protein
VTNRVAQFRSVLLMECILRFRRSATVALFLVLCAAAFLLMPEAGSGGVMFLIGQQRVLLNSAATALTSALMGGLVFSLMGFYLISNSVTRDLRSGVGRLVASTPLSSGRYLAGKLAGNIVYLVAVAIVFMIACMGMHLLRGEMPLEPLVFMRTFGIMFLPLIPPIAALALMFECVSFLSGRGGDVIYFFWWTLTLGLPVALVSASNQHAWILAADFTGMGFFVKEIIQVTGAHNFTIGYVPFNGTLSPAFFPGLAWVPELVVPRLGSVLLTIPFFLVAWAGFRRFDPARRGAAATKARSGRIARLRERLTFVWLRLVVPRGGWLAGPPSAVRATALDVRLTMAISPLFIVTAAASFLFSLFAPAAVVRSTVLPLMFLVLVPAIASIATRDRVGNTVAFLFSAPGVREHFAFVKFFSTLLATVAVGLIPLARVGLDDPFSAVALLVGMLFIAAAATFLGLLTGTPKTFGSLFLLFLYVALSSKTVPALDFAGWRRLATPSVVAAYAAGSVLMLAAAWGVERARNRLEL